MYIPENVICKVCKGIFCCAECRCKHELRNHTIPAHSNQGVVEQREVSKNGTLHLFCPICERRPLVLKADIQNELLQHIESTHLPLYCEKCFKVYPKVGDLRQFSKCGGSNLCHIQESPRSANICNLDDISEATVSKTVPQTVSTQTSPMRRRDFNETQFTPISVINLRWKSRSKISSEEFIGDSVSSIKNLSSIGHSSSRRSAGTSAVKGKIIRSTSTPVHLEMVFAKPKEQVLGAIGNDPVSSIYSSGCDSDNSPPLSESNGQRPEPLGRNRKVGTRPKITAVTPLRQVMSKSIQKAFAEHGLPTSTAALSSIAYQRKEMLNAAVSPTSNTVSPVRPLDLRMSPVVRRSKSESEESAQSGLHRSATKLKDETNLRRRILLSAQTESIVITHTQRVSSVSSSSSGTSFNKSLSALKSYSSTNSSYQSAASNSIENSVFQTCRSVEIITATTELSGVNVKENFCKPKEGDDVGRLQSLDQRVLASQQLPPITPITRIPGAAMNKKLIHFETPEIESSVFYESQHQCSPGEAFFTPSATPARNLRSPRDQTDCCAVPEALSRRFSPMRRPSIKRYTGTDGTDAFSRIEDFSESSKDNDVEDEVFLSQEESPTKKEQKTGGLWSLMTSVMRLPSLKTTAQKSSKEAPAVRGNSTSIIKRCASIAGTLIRQKPLVDGRELQTLKRKRTYTVDSNPSTNRSQSHFTEPLSPNADSFYSSSKRFRIQGRRPIDRMRIAS